MANKSSKKHVRQIRKEWRKMGCKSHPIYRGTGHPVYEVTLPDGRRKRVPIASSPKNLDHAIINAIKQIQDVIDGKDINL